MVDSIPQISVIIKVSRISKSLGVAFKSLLNQTIASQVELVLLSCLHDINELKPEEFKGLSSIKIIPIDESLHEGEYKAVGISHSSAPFIMFLEDHSYPAPDCLENILSVHKSGNYPIVGPIVLNANPFTSVSWGGYLVFYGQWGYARPEDCNEHLPANQSCYSREILFANRESLAEKLKAESVFHWALISKGQKLKLTELARVYHLGPSRLSFLLKEYFFNSRLFAASRFKPEQLIKRTIYTLGSPLIPFIRLWRIIKLSKHAKLPVRTILYALPSVWSCLCSGAVGEMFGYFIGKGNAEHHLHQLMINPDFLVQQNDIDLIEATLFQ